MNCITIETKMTFPFLSAFYKQNKIKKTKNTSSSEGFQIDNQEAQLDPKIDTQRQNLYP